MHVRSTPRSLGITHTYTPNRALCNKTHREHQVTYLPVTFIEKKQNARNPNLCHAAYQHTTLKLPHRRSHVICAILSALSQSLHKRHISAQKRSFVEGLSISLYLKPTPWYPDPPLSSTGPLSLPSIASNRYTPCTQNAPSTRPTRSRRIRRDETRAPPKPLLPRPEAALQRRQRRAHTRPPQHTTITSVIAHKTLFAEKETPTLKEYVQGGQNKHRMYI